MKPIKWLALVLLCVTLGAGAGCGKKSAPNIPQEGFSAGIRNLSGTWQGAFIRLQAELEGSGDGVQGARVYYGAYDPAEPPCEGCPVRYHGYHEFGVEALEKGGFSCSIPGKRRDALYYFKVHLIGPEGGLGPASDRVRVDPVSS